MKLHLKSSTVDKTISGEVAWGDGAVVDLGTKDVTKYVEALVKATDPKIGLLPPAVRWISNDKRIVVFERPPSYQHIEYFELSRDDISNYGGVAKLKSRQQPSFEYVLPFPWLVYIMGFGFDYQPVSLRVYMRPEPIFKMTDPLYLFPMLNFYTNSKLCNPIFEKFEQNEPSITSGIHSAYHTVWNSGFNFDLVDAVKTCYNHGSPFKAVKNPAIYGWGGQLRNYFDNWQNKTLADMLDCKMMNPSNAENNSSQEMTIHLSAGISAVHGELSKEMGANVTKSFITSLVNNFNLV